MMRDYTSTRGNTYKVGANGVPSPLTVVESSEELAELQGYSSQFEFVEVADEKELASLLQYEMEMRARAGGAPIRAEVLGASVPAPETPRSPLRTPAAVLAAAAAVPGPSPIVAPAAAPAVVPAAVPSAPPPVIRSKRTAGPEPKARLDGDGDEVFDPAPVPAAPVGLPDEGASKAAAAPATSGARSGGRRGARS
jgi:hypothetical protein